MLSILRLALEAVLILLEETWCLVNEQNHPLQEILTFLQKMIRLKNFKWDDQNNLRCNFAKIQSFSCENYIVIQLLDLLLSFSTIPFIFPGYLNVLMSSNTMIGKSLDLRGRRSSIFVTGYIVLLYLQCEIFHQETIGNDLGAERCTSAQTRWLGPMACLVQGLAANIQTAKGN